MGFLRNQEIKMAMRLLAWRYEKAGHAVPAADQLHQQADRLVEEAHRIACQRGGNVLAILKEMITDVRRS